MSDSPIRDAREVVRDCEARLAELQLDDHVPARDLWGPGWEPWYYVTRARSALRLADKELAKADDPRLSVLTPLKRLVRRLKKAA